MARVTKSALREEVANLQRLGCDIMIQWAYGQPRCYSLDQSRELSPRLSTGQMSNWLHGYYAGLSAGAAMAKSVK